MECKNAAQMFKEAGFDSFEVNHCECYYRDINVPNIELKVTQRVTFEYDYKVFEVENCTPDVIPIIIKRLEELNGEEVTLWKS